MPRGERLRRELPAVNARARGEGPLEAFFWDLLADLFLGGMLGLHAAALAYRVFLAST